MWHVQRSTRQDVTETDLKVSLLLVGFVDVNKFFVQSFDLISELMQLQNKIKIKCSSL